VRGAEESRGACPDMTERGRLEEPRG
jgi:hypothetical protein